MTQALSTGLTLLTLVLAPAEWAAAEWQVKPYMGFTFAGTTTFVDPGGAAGKAQLVVGSRLTLLGNILGLEADLGHAPGFFQSGEPAVPGVPELVEASRVTTFTGNVVVAIPRRLTEYTLRPYFVGGFGLMRVRIDRAFDVLPVKDTLPAVNLGVGVTGFLTDRVGLDWDLRHFRSMERSGEGSGGSFGAESLSFWRATMALALRY